jgi:ATP-independent RNA helicase DbpA
LCGGVPLRGHAASLEHGAHIVVGTPGRVMDHLDRGSLDLEALNTWVLDEADRMLDMGFYDDIVRVAQRCPAQRQTLLFSATYPEGIAKLAERFMRDPQTIRVEAAASAGRIRQRFYEVQDSARLHAVGQVLRHFRPASALAFCRSASREFRAANSAADAEEPHKPAPEDPSAAESNHDFLRREHHQAAVYHQSHVGCS